MSDKLKVHELRVDRAFAQGDVAPTTRKLIRYVDGKRVETKIKANSPNQERMNDALIGYFQNQVKSNFNYFDYRDQALLELEDKFKEHNLNIANLPYREKRIRAAAIQQVIDEKILSQFTDNPRMDIDFNEIIELSNLKSANTFKLQAEMLISVAGRSPRKVKKDIVDMDTMTIKETVYQTREEIIGYDIVLDPEMSEFFPKIEDFIAAKQNPLDDNKAFRNKKKYVRSVGIIFSKDVIPHIVCQGIDYVSLDPNVRQKFALQNTYAIDTYVTSIQHAQEWRQLTDFSPEKLMKKLGHSYKRFDRYLENIINPSIADFNKHDSRTLGYIIKRKGYEWGDENAKNAKTAIERFRWVITGYEKSLRDDIDSTTYCIALKILSQDQDLKNKHDSIKAFSSSIKAQLETDIPEMTILANKSVEDWLKDAKHELECEEKILEIFKYGDLVDILYDMESMSLISSKFDVENISTPSQSLQYLRETLKVKEPRKKKIKATVFPSDDAELIEEIIKSAIALDFNSALHFYFTFCNFYRTKETKNKDWRSVANLWLTNGKYDSRAERDMKFEIKYDNVVYTGEWEQENEFIETDEVRFEDVAVKQISELIAVGDLKPVGQMY